MKKKPEFQELSKFKPANTESMLKDDQHNRVEVKDLRQMVQIRDEKPEEEIPIDLDCSKFGLKAKSSQGNQADHGNPKLREATALKPSPSNEKSDILDESVAALDTRK